MVTTLARAHADDPVLRDTMGHEATDQAVAQKRFIEGEVLDHDLRSRYRAQQFRPDRQHFVGYLVDPVEYTEGDEAVAEHWKRGRLHFGDGLHRDQRRQIMDALRKQMPDV